MSRPVSYYSNPGRLSPGIGIGGPRSPRSYGIPSPSKTYSSHSPGTDGSEPSSPLSHPAGYDAIEMVELRIQQVEKRVADLAEQQIEKDIKIQQLESDLRGVGHIIRRDLQTQMSKLNDEILKKTTQLKSLKLQSNNLSKTQAISHLNKQILDLQRQIDQCNSELLTLKETLAVLGPEYHESTSSISRPTTSHTLERQVSGSTEIVSIRYPDNTLTEAIKLIVRGELERSEAAKHWRALVDFKQETQNQLTWLSSIVPKLQSQVETLRTVDQEHKFYDQFIPSDLKQEMDRLKASEDVYESFVQNNKISIGSWVSILPGHAPVVYSTYRKAAKDNEQKAEWFCKEYRGPNPDPIQVLAIGTYQKDGRSNDLAHIEAIISHPELEQNQTTSTMMIDTGSPICLGMHSLLRTRLRFKPLQSKIETIKGLGGAEIPLMYYRGRIKMGDLPQLSINIGCPLHDLTGSMQWILGQSFLKGCRHIWSGGTNVELQLLP
jgi:hypothetical protein